MGASYLKKNGRSTCSYHLIIVILRFSLSTQVLSKSIHVQVIIFSLLPYYHRRTGISKSKMSPECCTSTSVVLLLLLLLPSSEMWCTIFFSSPFLPFYPPELDANFAWLRSLEIQMEVLRTTTMHT